MFSNVGVVLNSYMIDKDVSSGWKHPVEAHTAVSYSRTHRR